MCESYMQQVKSVVKKKIMFKSCCTRAYVVMFKVGYMFMHIFKDKVYLKQKKCFTNSGV